MTSEPIVWALQATDVELVTSAGREALNRGANGWWLRDEPLAAGTDYRIGIDGGEPLPDPRSPWQPEGPHGPSRALDHNEFTWTDHDWQGADLAEMVVYECHIGTFGPQGTFDGVIEELDHLVDLGVTAVELMPAAEFSGTRGWGYDGVDLYAPHHAYGGPDGLKRLVDAAHRRGLAVILDVVYNHLGPDGNYLGRFGPYFTDRYSTPWGDAINFDGPDSSQVRDFFIGNAEMWMRDYHVDGVRLDAIHAIFDMSAIHFLEEVVNRIEKLERELGRKLWVIAESDLNDPRVVARREDGGYGVDAQWSDDFHHALHTVLTEERSGYYEDFGSIEQLTKALRNAFVYDGRYSKYRRRTHGKPPKDIPGHRFFGYMQNHDQVGNRAQGDRSSALMSPDLLKVATALVLTSPFVPMLFQGEEWGATTPFLYFTDHNEALGRLVREGRRREFAAFGWRAEEIPEPQDVRTFERSKLRWDELEDPRHADLLEWHKALIRLRRDTPSLWDGRMDLVEAEFDESARWLVVRRGPITIACNFSEQEREIPVTEDRSRQIVLSSAKDPTVSSRSATLPAQSVTIWQT